METFSALLAICAGNSAVPGEFPVQRPVTRSFDVFFDLRLNKRLSKQSWGWWFETLPRPLWRHSNVLNNSLAQPCKNFRVAINGKVSTIATLFSASELNQMLSKVTETELSSFWRNYHWLHIKLSFWELPAQPVMTNLHYSDVIMGVMTSQITSLTVVYSTVYSGTDQRKYQSSASLSFVRGIHRPVTGEFPAQRASNAENISIWWRHHAKLRIFPFQYKPRTVFNFSDNQA